jgi:O-antigen ligase
VIARIDNYKRTIQIFKISPVFGVGYDNICLAKAKLDGSVNFFYHDCSGSDSSLLLILATTGVIGIMVFCFSAYKIVKSLKRNSYSVILSSSFAALLVHSLFSNSLFYPWILGYIVILLAISVKD